MNEHRIILFVSGVLLSVLSVAMLVPALMDWIEGDPNWVAFLLSASITGFFGVLIALAFYAPTPTKLTIRQAFLLTTSCWVSVSLFASLPFYLSDSLNTFTDSFFESVSALTTTGATVFTDLEATPYGTLLWRALLQWLGGIGIVVMALAILPILRIGGMQLFRSEFSDTSEKALPRVSQITSSIVVTYSFLSLLCALLLWLAGMNMFDALCHAMATLSTGGFSTHDASVGFFNNPAMEAIITVFMVLGGSTLILCTRALHGKPWEYWRDSQIRTYAKILFFAVLIMTLWLSSAYNLSFIEALRHASFNITSIITTTGFSSTDYGLWGTFPLIFFFFLMFIGGCTGSTSGGIKIFRYQILLSAAKLQLEQLRRPHGIFVTKYNDAPISEKAFMSVLAFFALYFVCYAALAVGLTLCDLDVMTSLSGSVAMISNIGPGLGPDIGPSGNFGPLPSPGKWLMIFGMIAGRLELLTVMILFTPGFWKA